MLSKLQKLENEFIAKIKLNYYQNMLVKNRKPIIGDNWAASKLTLNTHPQQRNVQPLGITRHEIKKIRLLYNSVIKQGTQ